MSVIQSLAHCCSLRLEFTLKLCVNNKLKRMSALETPGQSQTKEWEGTEGITLQAPEPSKILSCLVFLMFLPCYCSNHPNSGFHWIQIVGHASLARLRTHDQSCWRLPKSRGYPQIIHFNRMFHDKPSMLMHFGGTPIDVGNLHIPMTTWSTLRPRVHQDTQRTCNTTSKVVGNLNVSRVSSTYQAGR